MNIWVKIGMTVLLAALTATNLYVASDEFKHKNFVSACVGSFTAGICLSGVVVGIVGILVIR